MILETAEFTIDDAQAEQSRAQLVLLNVRRRRTPAPQTFVFLFGTLYIIATIAVVTFRGGYGTFAAFAAVVACNILWPVFYGRASARARVQTGRLRVQVDGDYLIVIDSDTKHTRRVALALIDAVTDKRGFIGILIAGGETVIIPEDAIPYREAFLRALR